MAMLVNSRSAHKCCKDCDVDYGHSQNRKAKTKLKRSIRRREKTEWRKDY